MCIICVQYEQGRLTAREAVKNLNEMTVWDDHSDTILEKFEIEVEQAEAEAKVNPRTWEEHLDARLEELGECYHPEQDYEEEW